MLLLLILRNPRKAIKIINDSWLETLMSLTSGSNSIMNCVRVRSLRQRSVALRLAAPGSAFLFIYSHRSIVLRKLRTQSQWALYSRPSFAADSRNALLFLCAFSALSVALRFSHSFVVLASLRTLGRRYPFILPFALPFFASLRLCVFALNCLSYSAFCPLHSALTFILLPLFCPLPYYRGS